jgi:hypothetical protein
MGWTTEESEFNSRQRQYTVLPKSQLKIIKMYIKIRYKYLYQLVQVLCYKSEGREFESRRGHWIFFDLPNSTSRTMGLGLTQPLTEMSTRNVPGGKVRPERMADYITTICESIV